MMMKSESCELVSAMKIFQSQLLRIYGPAFQMMDIYIFTGHFLDNNWKLYVKTLASKHIQDRHTR